HRGDAPDHQIEGGAAGPHHRRPDPRLARIPEAMTMFDRRIFLKSSGLALVAGGLLPNVFVKMAGAATTGGKRVVVAIFQRGAVDGLNVVVPYAEQAYYAARPTIAIPRGDILRSEEHTSELQSPDHLVCR